MNDCQQFDQESIAYSAHLSIVAAVLEQSLNTIAIRYEELRRSGKIEKTSSASYYISISLSMNNTSSTLLRINSFDLYDNFQKCLEKELLTSKDKTSLKCSYGLLCLIAFAIDFYGSSALALKKKFFDDLRNDRNKVMHGTDYLAFASVEVEQFRINLTNLLELLDLLNDRIDELYYS